MATDRIAAITVLEGLSPVLVGYAGWHEWRRERVRPALPEPPLVPAGAASCAMCWSNGHIYEQAGNGEGLIPVVCSGCNGWGTVSTAPAA